MFAVLALAYVASQFFRVSNAVIAPELMRTLHLSPEAMGLVTAAFFFAFGAMQIPTGILLDRIGPRRTMSSLLIIAALGSALFAVGT
ncbi:MAG: MFS transporter, partial [Gammaproteobacteria bacterium]|nr:MFS transporter [Gammaproteobacteria bacterium]